MSKLKASLEIGQELDLGLKGYSGAVKWSGSNKKVATVSSKGVVTAKKNGTDTITATTKDGSKKRATGKVTVLKGKGYVTLEERYADEEKRLNNPVNDAATNIFEAKQEVAKGAELLDAREALGKLRRKHFG